ncbi:MAG: hypothetical protein IKU19_05985, partial [Clostridia bacterium]|nr:hypothetical protein [Clostridia bacterium]
MAEPEDTAEVTADQATTDTAEGEATDGTEAEGEAADDTAADAEGEEGEEGEEGAEDEKFNYLATGSVFNTADEKLNAMVKKTEAFGYALYCDEYTGEVAVKNLTTGQVLFTNPYDLAGSPSSEDVKRQLMSQIEIRYSDSTGTKTSMFSYTEACEKNQIRVKNLKNGLRVEYSLGDEEVRFLVPMQIEKSRYEELIKTHIDNSDLSNRIKNKFSTEGYYVLKDPFDTTLSVREVREMQEDFPVTEEMAIYVFDTEASTREIQEMETYIKSYCPEYTFATLEEDHQLTRYTSTQKAPPLFKMALEYYLDEDGLQIRLPANGIRFDEDEYQLVYVRILPYFGAGSSAYNGYTFIPDGSGALFDFQQLKSEGGTITGKVYGTDFAYHEITTVKSEIMRLPVYGVVENYVGQSAVIDESATQAAATETVEGTEAEAAETETAAETVAEAAETETAETTETEAAETETAETTEATDTEAAEGTEAETEETEAEDGEEAPARSDKMPVVKEYVPLTEDRGYLAIIEEGDALASITTNHGGNLHRYNSVYTEFYPRPSDSYNLSDSISVGDDKV